MGLAVACEQRRRSASLVLVLPTEPVTRDDLGLVRARARPARDRAALRARRARRAAARPSANRRAGRRRTTASAGARCKRGLDEIVAVAAVALDGEERFAWRDRAACRSRCPERRGQRARRSAPMAAAIASTVQSGRSRHAHLSLSAAATASWSLNGSIWSPMIWPVSWPLPAISSTSPGASSRNRARGSPRAGRRSRSRRARAARIAARIAAGSSLRGLSSVTMTRSALRGGDRAHQRPLAGVAVAAAAEHHDEALPLT